MKNAAIISLLLLLGLTAFWSLRQQKDLAAAQGGRIALQKQLSELQSQLDASAEQLLKLKNDQERMLRDQSELARLRADTARLRQQLKQLESARAAMSTAAAARPSSAQPPATPLPPVQNFSSKCQAVLPWNSGMVSGGWSTAQGKRSFIFLQPQIADASSPGQLVLRSRFVEIPEEAIDQLGLRSLVSDKKDLTAHIALNPEQLAAIYSRLKEIPGADILSSPTIQTSSGTPAEASVTQPYKADDGQTYQLGPTVHINPAVTPGGEAVDLTVNASLNLRTEPAPAAP